MRSTFISLAAIAAISMSACGSDASSSADGATAEALPDACTLLSDDEVEQLTGELPSTARFAGIEGSLSVCQWGDGTADFFSVTLQTDHDWDAQVEIAAGREDAEYREITGVGDRAYVELERFVQAEHDGLLVITGPVDEEDIGSLESMTNTIITRLP
jgi:hypothetical protein